MANMRRLNKLEERMKPMKDKAEREKKEHEENEELFRNINEIMRISFQEHKWNTFDETRKKHLAYINDDIWGEAQNLVLEYLRWRMKKSDNISKEESEQLWLEHKPKAIEKVKMNKQY